MTDAPGNLSARCDYFEGQLRALGQFSLALCRLLRIAAERGKDGPSGEALQAVAAATETAAARLALWGDVSDDTHNGFEAMADMLNRARLDIELSSGGAEPVRDTRFRLDG